MQKCRDATHWILGALVLLLALAIPGAAHAASSAAHRGHAFATPALDSSPADHGSLPSPDATDLYLDEEDNDDECSRGPSIHRDPALRSAALDLRAASRALEDPFNRDGFTVAHQFLADSARRL